jgi:hypothetical protein
LDVVKKCLNFGGPFSFFFYVDTKDGIPGKGYDILFGECLPAQGTRTQFINRLKQTKSAHDVHANGHNRIIYFTHADNTVIKCLSTHL